MSDFLEAMPEAEVIDDDDSHPIVDLFQPNEVLPPPLIFLHSQTLPPSTSNCGCLLLLHSFPLADASILGLGRVVDELLLHMRVHNLYHRSRD